MAKSFHHIETFLLQKKHFSSLVSTLAFVLGQDVQIHLESAHSLFSYTQPSNIGTIMARCKNKITPSEKTLNNARRKDEITNRRQAKRRKYIKMAFFFFVWRFFVIWRSFFVISRGAFRYFVFSTGVISSFRYFVFSLVGVILFFASRHYARRKDEKAR